MEIEIEISERAMAHVLTFVQRERVKGAFATLCSEWKSFSGTFSFASVLAKLRVRYIFFPIDVIFYSTAAFFPAVALCASRFASGRCCTDRDFVGWHCSSGKRRSGSFSLSRLPPHYISSSNINCECASRALNAGPGRACEGFSSRRNRAEAKSLINN